MMGRTGRAARHGAKAGRGSRSRADGNQRAGALQAGSSFT
jgi:hypothetical protein